MLGAQADRAVGLGELHVVGHVVVEVHLRVALVVEELLPLADHARGSALLMIAVMNGIFSVVEVASSCAVIWKQPSPSIATRVVGPPGLGAERRRHGEPHRAQAAGVDPVRGFSNRQNCDAHIWCWPTPATTIVSPSRVRAEPLDRELRLERPVGLLVVAVAGSSLPLRELAEPGAAVGGAGLLLAPRELGDQLRDHVAAVAHDRARRRRGSCRSRPGRCRRGRSSRRARTSRACR